MHKICGFYIIYFSIELKRGSSKTNVLPLTKRQGVFFQSLIAAFNCYNLQYLLPGGQNCKCVLSRIHKICGFYIIYFSIELKIGSSKTRCVFFSSLWLLLLIVTNFSICWLQFFLSIMLGHFLFLTMTRKPTRLTHINATINRHDVPHPSEQSW